MSLRAMGQAAVTMNQLQQKLDTIGHNLANLQTAGYKARQAEFSALISQHIANMTDPRNAVGRQTPDGIRLGTGARIGSIHANLSIGAMQSTGRDLDTALINKHHFYQVAVEENGVEEIRYTRDGAFYLQPVAGGDEVMLVTRDGHPVIGNAGPIQFADGFDSIFIDENGTVSVKRGNENEIVGQLAIVEINRSRILEATGDNFFRLPDLDELGLAFGEIVQDVPLDERVVESSVLEMSNVRLEQEMTELMNAQRSYQFNARTISMMDQMQGLINQLR